MHNDEEIRIRNRARMIGDPDLKLLLKELDTLRANPVRRTELCTCVGCGPNHPIETQCEDLQAVIVGVLGGLLQAVCVECAVELIKGIV